MRHDTCSICVASIYIYTDRVVQNLEIISKNFRFSTRLTKILMGFIISTMSLRGSNRTSHRQTSGSLNKNRFRNNLKILCHPICNRCYASWSKYMTRLPWVESYIYFIFTSWRIQAIESYIYFMTHTVESFIYFMTHKADCMMYISYICKYMTRLMAIVIIYLQMNDHIFTNEWLDSWQLFFMHCEYINIHMSHQVPIWVTNCRVTK